MQHRTSSPTPRNLKVLTSLLLSYLIFITPLASFAAAAARSRQANSPGTRQTAGQRPQAAVEPQQVQAPAPQPTPDAPSAVTIAATKTASFTDADGDGKAELGQTITYTVQITNSGTTDATGVQFSDTVDPKTTFVANSAHASPIALPEAYTTIGNTLLEAGVAASGNPAVTSAVKLFDNDTISTGPDTIQLQTFQSTSAQGGTVSVNANGSFTYLPAAGFTGTDTFTYTIRNNNATTLTDTATVTITVNGPRVWYVNNSGANGDGRSSSPFNSLTPVNGAGGAGDADAAGDIIYLFTGAANYTTGLVMENNELLIGNGVALVVNTITLRAAGTRPTLATTGITLASGNTLSGFNFGNTGGFAISGTSVGTLTIDNMAINTTGGGLDLTGVGTPTVSVTLDSLTSSGGTKNVNLVGLNGTINLGSGALSSATANAFDVSGAGTANISYSGTIGNTAARSVIVANKTGGTIALSGAVSGSGTGISLTSNSGTTINFTGGISLSTGANAAFTATGGGTVTATQNNTTIVNTLTTTTGTALQVSNTTIGAAGLTFRSITSNGSGTANGIILDTTGANAGLIVTGNGGTCSSAATCTGGTISNKTGADGSTTQGSGIFLNSTSGVSLDRMQLNDFQNFGIKGASVTGFSLTNSRITGTSGTTEAGGSEEGPVRFDNLFTSGAFPTAQITGSTIQGGFSVNIRVTNTSGTLNRLVIDNCQLPSINSSNTNGGSSVLFDASGGATLNWTLSNSVVSSSRASMVNVTAQGGTHMDLVILQNKLQNANANILSGAEGIRIQAGANGAADLTFNISCNKISTSAAGGAKGAGINIFKAVNTTSGSFVGTVGGNAIGVVGQTLSGAPNSAPAIWIQDHGAGTFTTLIQNNTIVEYGEEAIDLQRTSGSSTLNASVFGNTVTPNAANGFCGLNIEQGAVAADTGTMNVVVGNSNAGSGQQNDFSNGDPFNTSDVQILRAASSTTVLNLSRNGSASGTVAQVIKDDNVNGANTAVFIPTTGSMNLVNTLPATPPSVASCTLPARPQFGESAVATSTDETSVVAAPAAEAPKQYIAAPQLSAFAAKPATTNAAPATTNRTQTRVARPNSPNANLPVNIGTLTAGKTVTITFQVTVNSPFPAGSNSVSNQGTVSGSNFSSVVTDDPNTGPVGDPTVTPVDAVSLTIADVSVAEGAVGLRTVTVTVNLSQTTNAGAFSVHYQTADHTATAPADYIAVPDTVLNIPGTSPTATFTVQVKGDTIFEGNEDFFVNLSNSTGNAAILDSQAVVTIADDEPMTADFDGDGLTDATVWNPANGSWTVRQSTNGQTVLAAADWGRSALGDVAVPGDYDGDNKIDIAIFRPSEGNWYILKSSLANTPFIQNWGQSGDIPVPGDYDNDGRIDIAVFRPSQGNWYILKSNNGSPINTVQNWGISTDKPVRGDFDGDGKNDLAVFRPAEGNWYILNSSSGTITITNWGNNATDKLVPGDYDGDGKTDLAVFRTSGPNVGTWFIRNSSGGVTTRSWGNATDQPVPGDYDGDGRTDIAVWRPSEGNWYAINSSTNTVNLQTNGLSGNVPAPNTYLPQ